MGIELLKIENKKMKSDIDAMNEYLVATRIDKKRVKNDKK